MIQIKRGKTKNWRKLKKVLAAGQPGYDKNKHKLKVGDGETLWKELPYASGLFAEEILNSEKEAKVRYTKDSEDTTIITYGTEGPDRSTVGQLYLQYYDTEPEVDHVVNYGSDGIWTYRKWFSGLAECWGTQSLTASIQDNIEDTKLYIDNKTMKNIEYPFTFIETPQESAALQSPAGIVWLAGRQQNSTTKSGTYSLLSCNKQNNATYKIALNVRGFWR